MWIYRKWNSGIAECWGTTNQPVTTTIFNGNVAFSDTITVTLPFTLAIQDYENLCLVDCYDPWSMAKSMGASQTAASYKIYRGGSYSSIFYPTVSIYVKGRWK